MKIILILLILNLSGDLFSQELPIRFFVADHKVECTTVTTHMCFLMKNSPEGDWKNYSGEITGFNYEPGFEYEITVRKKIIDNPPADAPSFSYELIELIRKTPSQTVSESDRKFLDKKEFTLKKIRSGKNLKKYKNQIVTMTLDLDKNTAFGNDGCNNYNGSFFIRENKISFQGFASTRMMCPDVTIDKLFHKTIRTVDSFKISGNSLKLYEGRKLMMEFIEAAPK